jgi:hypothetical protein
MTLTAALRRRRRSTMLEETGHSNLLERLLLSLHFPYKGKGLRIYPKFS